MKDAPTLRVENLTKRFPGTLANDHITLDVRAGEILSIVGENGAGKSTFCKMLTGVVNPDEGDIYVNGEKVKIDSPINSMRMGIAMVYQERNLVGNLSVAENVCLGHEPKKGGLLDMKAIRRESAKVRDELGITIPVEAKAASLGAGEQQLVEIMRAFYNKPSLLILDEPTASLGQSEVEPFLEFIMRIKSSMNMAIIFISHKLDEVFKISDRIAVFTDGKCVLCESTGELTQERCISAMLRDNKINALKVKEKDFSDEEMLIDVRDCQYDGKGQKIAFKVRSGEIVGFYGLVGSGRTECAEVLCGMRPFDKREFTIGSEVINGQKHTPRDMLHKGVVLTPERRASGVFKSFSLSRNIDTMFLEKLLANKSGVINFKKAKAFSQDVLTENDVKYSSIEQPIYTLSGGNIQKVIIGRSLKVANVKLLMLDEPTAGMDIGAKYEVYHKILDVADRTDLGVVFISSELEELIAICHRIYVFSNGDIFEEFERSDFDKEAILRAAMRKSREKELSL